jgi:hypothetical protein
MNYKNVLKIIFLLLNFQGLHHFTLAPAVYLPHELKACEIKRY